MKVVANSVICIMKVYWQEFILIVVFNNLLMW